MMSSLHYLYLNNNSCYCISLDLCSNKTCSVLLRTNIDHNSQSTLYGGSGGTAEIHLQPPEPFNFRNPDDWPCWKRRFQQFREASGLDKATETKQVNTFYTA